MNKYRGSNFEYYLKEKGISEEVLARAKKRWKALRAEAWVVPEDTTKSRSDLLNSITGFFTASIVVLITCLTIKAALNSDGFY